MTETAPTSAFAAADRLLVQALDALDAVAASGDEAALVGLVTRCESAVRRLDRVTVSAVAGLERRGVFVERGYTSPACAVADLLGCEPSEARRRVLAAEQLVPRVGLDGAALPARLPATAVVFADGRAGLRDVDAIARVLGSPTAGGCRPSSGRGWRSSWPRRPTATPRPRCGSGARRWSSCSTTTAPSPTTDPGRRSTSCT